MTATVQLKNLHTGLTVYIYIYVSITGLDPKTLMSAAFSKFGLGETTIDFIGHALALYRDDL